MEKIKPVIEDQEHKKHFLEKDKLREFGITEEGESIYDVFDRVPSVIAKIESQFSTEEVHAFQERISKLLKSKKFIPSTTILMNAGRFGQSPMSACAVPPVDLHKDLQAIKQSVRDYNI